MSQSEQLKLFDEVPKEKWYSKTVNELKKYPKYKLALAGASLHEDPQMVHELEKKRKKVMLIDLALSPLTELERKIIEMSYFARPKQKDLFIRLELGMSHSTFYTVKDEIMAGIATVLNIL